MDFDYLNHLSIGVHTGKGDRILSAGAGPLPELMGDVYECRTLAEAEGKYKLIVSENALSGEYNYSEHFALGASLLEEQGFYMMFQRLTRADDAWVNALVATVDPLHIRFPRVEEVVSVAAEYLELAEFIHFIDSFSYDVPDNMRALVEKQLAEFPKNLQELTSPVLNAGKLKINQLVGVFVWHK